MEHRQQEQQAPCVYHAHVSKAGRDEYLIEQIIFRASANRGFYCITRRFDVKKKFLGAFLYSCIRQVREMINSRKSPGGTGRFSDARLLPEHSTMIHAHAHARHRHV